MTVNEMRNYILKAYPYSGVNWRNRVIKMKPKQVIAVYYAIKERERRNLIHHPEEEPYHQIDVFEFMTMRQDVPGSHTRIAV